MEQIELGRASFGRLALRMGIVNQGDLQQALALTAASGGSREASLLNSGALTSELAEHVRAAVRVVRGSLPGGAHLRRPAR